MPHADLSDQQFLSEIETITINPELFSHEAHIRMAWLYLAKHGKEEALAHISAAIRGIDAKYAGGTKYHHTITIVFAETIATLMAQGQQQTWQEFIAKNTGLNISKKFLAEYYSDELLYSDAARAGFVEPDRKPFACFRQFELRHISPISRSPSLQLCALQHICDHLILLLTLGNRFVTEQANGQYLYAAF